MSNLGKMHLKSSRETEKMPACLGFYRWGGVPDFVTQWKTSVCGWTLINQLPKEIMVQGSSFITIQI
jgi:hypothetical protein